MDEATGGGGHESPVLLYDIPVAEVAWAEWEPGGDEKKTRWRHSMDADSRV